VLSRYFLLIDTGQAETRTLERFDQDASHTRLDRREANPATGGVLPGTTGSCTLEERVPGTDVFLDPRASCVSGLDFDRTKSDWC
jgi:hypothetical protein